VKDRIILPFILTCDRCRL